MMFGSAQNNKLVISSALQIKFEKDLKRIWLKAGLKEAPENWQTPKIYMKNK